MGKPIETQSSHSDDGQHEEGSQKGKLGRQRSA